MPFEYYITKNNKSYRCGYTTGSCAVMAAKAALEYLFTGITPEYSGYTTPKGIYVSAGVSDLKIENGAVSCCVIKDGGDDIDVTDGLKIYASVRKIENGISIDGGEGVGRVTRKGLDCEVGAAAINSVPRRLLKEETEEICRKYGYTGGIEIIISVPNGREAAEKTFNPRLGIEGGISIIGTSGIVEPMSTRAIIDTIGAELKVMKGSGAEGFIAVPGNYGENFIKGIKGLEGAETVKFSNYVGELLDFAAEYKFKNVLLAGHIGKFVKLAGGIMNTHSSFADCRMEILAAHTALYRGADVCREIMACTTTDEALELLEKYGVFHQIMDSVAGKAEYYVNMRTRGFVSCGVIIYSDKRGLLSAGKNVVGEFGGEI